MNKIYGFEGEVRSKLGEKFVELFAEIFCWLPLAHVINKKVFVVHGGLFSVDGVKLSDIRSIDRFCEPPEEGMVAFFYSFLPDDTCLFPANIMTDLLLWQFTVTWFNYYAYVLSMSMVWVPSAIFLNY